MTVDQHPPDTQAPNQRPRLSPIRVAIAIVAFLAVAAAAIGWVVNARNNDEPAPEAATQPTASVIPSAPPAAAQPSTPEDIAVAEARAIYEEYLRIDDAVAQGGYTDVTLYETVAVDPELTQLKAFAAEDQEQDLRVIGDTTLASISAESVSLRDDSGYYPEVILSVCLDVSNIDVLDSSGNSVVSPDRPDRYRGRATVRQYQPGTPGVPPDGGWFVAETDLRGEPC